MTRHPRILPKEPPVGHPSQILGARPKRKGNFTFYNLPWSRYEIALLLGVMSYLSLSNLRVNDWKRVTAMMGTGRSAAEVSRFFYVLAKRKIRQEWLRAAARAKVGLDKLFVGARAAALQSYKNRKWKLWTTREKRILLFRMIRKPDLLYGYSSGPAWAEIARGFWARTPGALRDMYHRHLSVQWPLRRIRSFGTSKKGLFGLRYTREDYEKMVDWMICRPRLGYGRPDCKNGSGWHKMALSFPGRTASTLYKKYTSFLVKIWPLRDIKHEALRRKLENSKPVIE
jgi:hypothetical protein